jgi:hypothetical protein
VPIDFAFGLDHADRVEPFPKTLTRDAPEVAEDRIATSLLAPVPFLDGFENIDLHISVVSGIGIDKRIFDLFCQGTLVALERQHIVGPGIDDLLGNLALAACLASMVTMQPLRTSNSSRRGIAVISLDFCSVATCASTRRLSAAHALTRWSAPRPAPRSCERRELLPSMATISPGNICRMLATHARKHSSNASGRNSENTRRKVSWDGIPFSSPKNSHSQSSLLCANSATSTQLSAPAITAAMEIATISNNLCRTLVESRGSSRTLNCATNDCSSISSDISAHHHQT